MEINKVLPLALGLVIFSFLITAVLVVPFIDFLYKLKFTRKVEGKGGKKKMLFDKLHDIKAGTPIGGGLLVISVVTILFSILLPLSIRMGVPIRTLFSLRYELLIILFTFISFGLLGATDDFVKIFGKARKDGKWEVFGLTRKQKFILQIVLGTVIAWMIHSLLGIHQIYIPLFEQSINLTIAIGGLQIPLYVPLAAFIIIFFSNAFNITDGLDGLSSGLLMIYLFSYIIIAVDNLDTPLFIFISLWLGSIIAFLYFNVYPARIFLGDAGALSFGAMMAVIGLMIGNIATLFIIGGLFVLELLSSLIQILSWKLRDKPFFKIAPIHHTFQAIGWEEPKIVMRAWLAGVMLAVFGLWLATI